VGFVAPNFGLELFGLDPIWAKAWRGINESLISIVFSALQTSEQLAGEDDV